MPGDWRSPYYQVYLKDGGTAGFEEWVAQGMPHRRIPVQQQPGTYSEENDTYAPLVAAGGSAAEMAAAVTRATYEDWKKTYFPISQQLMNEETTYNNPALVSKGVNEAVSTVNRSFDSAGGQQGRVAARYGIALTPEQQAVNERVGNLGRSKAVVDAANRIRQRLADRDREIAMGGVPNLGGKNYGGNQ